MDIEYCSFKKMDYYIPSYGQRKVGVGVESPNLHVIGNMRYGGFKP